MLKLNLQEVYAMTENLKTSLTRLDVQLDQHPRTRYLQYIQRVVELALYKFEHKQTKNSERIAWGRLVVQAITAGNAMLKDQDLQAITVKLAELEKLVKS